ncbi:Pls/PosA family non-ribosomal peptide synthetase [Rathayibacter toxicus]|uniref:Pls/PosA family non-ribosomal peptide synthetase n=1 Tax=Rathayibacter toxicus TaxID=145458 RepID=UPI001C77D596|nr:Pls/PosA family non-ribosomal peptide synthetase [Rathayibacter toxicus]QWL31971.1 amino acid adenylation domain-containing protein [Rathayibacter toxicus]QWL34065.1 amino acid adenylation domain-containing protein [Rathayibacter toxicus]QWL36197.1 amino acid adenylation domain-containing protein [Rathayibacter toxicus]QWL38288.1 amino acid adenylation domain-containing protein [Rathayibacter toxicus]QWL40377.1 amino acid adenylation domain-containing protein [Rathayibacter toxicus]
MTTAPTSNPQDALDAGDRVTPPRTLIDVLRDTAQRHPDASALDDPSGALSYRELLARVVYAAGELTTSGVRRGDRVGVRMPSGSRELYLAILAVLAAGAAYVPVDADDPEERAQLVFGEAGVRGVITGSGHFEPGIPGSAPVEKAPARLFAASAPHPSAASIPLPQPPSLEDDAWIIFTSGSTGTPKGVAVSHRSAAAFVDAESRLFLQQEPLGPGDRVLAGLSVAFDASCEEMWLAWRHGACLVPAPRSLVRSGMDLGPWLTTHGITVVSTVPTLAALWPAESLENVRLLIFGGEACPPELGERLAVEGREVWNTYGPTEATVVACAAPLGGPPPVRIGLPLEGWRLAVVDAEGRHVGEGEVGELVIGGVGLARYLDPAKDAEKYAPAPTLGWERAYRSGDLVRFESAGLVFQGRADDQVKLGGRRIELGEVEAALQGLPGVSGAAAAVRTTSAGNQLLVGYLALADGRELDRDAALTRLREELPAALVPLLAVVDELPTRTSGKVDRAALPWPLADAAEQDPGLDPATAWLAGLWREVLGVTVDERANFFDLGGGSLAAAQLVARIRERDPEFTVADVYAHPRLAAMSAEIASRATGTTEVSGHTIPPVPRRMQVLQTLLGAPLLVLGSARWLTAILTVTAVLDLLPGFGWLPTVPLVALVPAFAVLCTPFGRMGLTVLAARLLLRGVRAGNHPRGGGVHLRLWLAEQVAFQLGAVSLAGAPWVSYFARALGARIAEDVDLHSLPPLTGMLTLGRGAAIEPEVDLSGYWIDGDLLRVGAVGVGAGSTVGARSTLLPGARIGKNAQIEPGSAVFGRVPAGQRWGGSPAQRLGKANAGFPAERPPRRTAWVWAYGVSAVGLAAVPILAFAAGVGVVAVATQGAQDLGDAAPRAFAVLVPAVGVAGVVLALLVVTLVRLMGLGVEPGTHPVRGRIGWQVWSTERLLDQARTLLFPLYSGLFTPVWLRLLGARVGRNVEASTVLLLPGMTTIRDGAFLADDTLVASYALGGGWMRLARAEIGERAFLGNSGMAAPGHTVPAGGLVAVLSSAPRKSKAGSSWLGSPPVRLRRTVVESEASLTFRPPARLRAARIVWELCRFVPVVVSVGLGLAVVLSLLTLTEALGAVAAAPLGGIVLLLAGAVAAAISTAAKWLLIQRVRPSEQPLWSSFVWRSELADTFTEMVAAPWFAHAAAGTPALVWWLRSLGARIGRGVWCESYWLPEADLVDLGDGAAVNRGCVVQTHLFHDRIMSMDSVRLDPGATLGPHSVILPAARIAAHGTVGPASLVMRGELVPAGSRWSGNPIGPWREVRVADYAAPVA